MYKIQFLHLVFSLFQFNAKIKQFYQTSKNSIDFFHARNKRFLSCTKLHDFLEARIIRFQRIKIVMFVPINRDVRANKS